MFSVATISRYTVSVRTTQFYVNMHTINAIMKQKQIEQAGI